MFSAGIVFYFCLPDPLFNVPYSTSVVDRNGNLLDASIAADNQWRFPLSAEIPEKYIKSVLTFEDQYFYYHPGFNPISLIRAAIQNILAGEIVSGGSTITMQVIRMSRNNRPRTIPEKFIEIILAIRLELRHTKNEILKLYAAHAPFGGNIVGLEAASWRYFNRPPGNLSWAEVATLSVLPNQPGLIFPGKNQKILLKKRNQLLDKLTEKGFIDPLTKSLAESEPLPEFAYPLPSKTPHLLTRLMNEGNKGNAITVYINKNLQNEANEIVEQYSHNFSANHIQNMAALVAEVSTGHVLVYIGNTHDPMRQHSNDVDIITASRSTGSILKPFLYAAEISEGMLLPDMLIPDIPTNIDGFAPKNYTKTYEGAVPASRALARSLNVPAVRMLREYRTGKFIQLLKNMGIATIDKEADYYGLSLILGGGEASLWELTSAYGSLGRILNRYFIYPEPYRYNISDVHPLSLIYSGNNSIKVQGSRSSVLPAGAIWHMFQAMSKVYRPEEDISWQLYQSGRTIAWKTGTSYGNRDAWAIGLNSDYIVGVWVGNASGEGRPRMTGLHYAAPVMFDLFNLLPSRRWFQRPGSELVPVSICQKSGFRSSVNCDSARIEYVYKAGINAPICPYCYIVHLDRLQEYRVNSDCEKNENITVRKWFILPPVMEWYYKSANSQYEILPSYKKKCKEVSDDIPSMAMIYPEQGTRIYIPKELNGERGKAIFELAHRNSETIVYWHLDSTYLGYTKTFHQMGIKSSEGPHVITVVDENGETVRTNFYVISREGE